MDHIAGMSQEQQKRLWSQQQALFLWTYVAFEKDLAKIESSGPLPIYIYEMKRV